ncbi:MAG: hypothetical protein JWP25_6984 [Bradyrhizobium sp.]|jgi:hypothetical protein|nr:hypothetical protein [Bradyrhizobium sp.]MEA2867568.1 hypothetical protein [Bradyrhizobium sp.]
MAANLCELTGIAMTTINFRSKFIVGRGRSLVATAVSGKR